MDEDEVYADIPDSETTCTICYAEFLDPDDLIVHTAQVHSAETSKRHPCKFCPSTFSNMEDFALHIRDAHICSIKCCKYCTRAFTDFDMLRKHESKHYTYVKKSMYSCSQCRQMFTNIFDLEQHELKKHSDEKDGVMLQECFSVLSSVLNIKAVTFLHSLGTNTIYICVKCQFTSPKVDEYIKHLQKQICRSFVCDTCSNVYKERTGLVKHLTVHTECQNYIKAEDLKKKCSECHKFVNAQNFSQHLKNCKPIKCNSCNIVYANMYELSEHQNKKHPLAITLKTCQFCRKEFVGSIALEKHVNRIHKGQFHLYKYACVHCENTYYKHPKDLFGHFFSKHQELKPYSCKICDKTFRVRKKFTIHIKMEHNSVGFVEFDENYHVFFTEKKSENPFQPTSLFPTESDDNASGNENADENTTEPQEPMSQTEKTTDAETVDESKDVSESEKLPPKIRFKEQKRLEETRRIKNLYSDMMSATETENDAKPAGKTLKRQRKSKISTKPSNLTKSELLTETENETKFDDNSSESDDMPLLVVKKRQKTQRMTKLRFAAGNHKKRSNIRDNKKRFTCNICKKYCYTFQNYNHHVSLHFKNEVKKCIKCSKEFRTKIDLKRHIDTEHSTSKLTETLRTLLERRKSGGNKPHQLTTAEKFRRTMRKVKADSSGTVAKLTEVKDKLSVQTFIESFTPEANETTKKPLIEFDTVVSIKTLNGHTNRPPVIKMTKFKPKPLPWNIKLTMPVKCKPSTEKTKVNIKLVNQQESINDVNDQNATCDNDYQDDSFVDYEENDINDKITVPEMAEEIMVEETQEPKPVTIPHKIVIPKLPKEYDNIRIAHLQAEAPYYKIVKMNDVIKAQKKEPEEEHVQEIKLPSGTKLVNVNPLAHLLGGKSVENLVGAASKKYYKPKTSNFENAIAKALLQLENPDAYPKRKKKKGVVVEQ